MNLDLALFFVTVCILICFFGILISVLAYQDIMIQMKRKTFLIIISFLLSLLLFPIYVSLSIIHNNQKKHFEVVNVTHIDNKPIVNINNKITNIAGAKNRNWNCDKVKIEVTEDNWSWGIYYPKSWELIGESVD